MQHFVIIMCAPNLQHAKHTVTFCFSLKMASPVEERCHVRVLSLSEHSELLLLAPQFPNTFFQAVDGWWHLNVYGLYLRKCVLKKLIKFRQNTEFSGSPHFCFCPSHLFSHVLHTVMQREFIVLACSVNEWSSEKPFSMMEKGYTHTPTKSLYHSLQGSITKMNNWL